MAEIDARWLVDALPDAVVAADADQRILFANRSVERLLGWNPEDLVGRTLSDLIPPPHVPMDLGRPILVRAMRADGSIREVELTLSGPEDDGPDRLIATIREPGRESAAEDSARRLRAILETIPIGVLLCEGPEGRLTVSNPAADRIVGEPVAAASYAEFVEKFPLETLDGRRLGWEERPLGQTLRQGEPARALLRFHRRDGREAVLEIATAPIPRPDVGVVTTFADVTERFQLEQDSSNQAAQFRALIDHLPVGVAYFDKMAVCRAGNGPARRFLGRTRSEIAGVPADELFSQAPALRDGLRRCVREHVSHAQQGVPWPDSSRPGSVRYLDWRFEPLSSDPARSRGALALIMDVTERTRADAELQRAMETAEGASRRKTQFLSAVSHDLRTPINALSLQAELLSRIVDMRNDPGDELQLLAGDIRSVAANLIELINDLLDLTRFDSGAVDYHPSEFSLEDWLAVTVAPLELSARTKDLNFSWSVDRPGRIIRGDRVKLGRVLVNLVGNAVKFTEEGGVAIWAGVDSAGWFRLEVRDTGPGIPADQLSRIFDEFAQLRNPERDRTKGTGLGLAICRRLVEGVGGRMTVESEPGHGSVFTAIYPPDHVVDEPSPRIVTVPDAPPTPRPNTPATILLVEDDPTSRMALARLLEHAGYTVAAAGTGPEAMELLENVTPALILLDLMLPGMDGAEVLRRIRSAPTLHRLKVVVLTGDVMTSRSGELQALDVDGLLGKPVDLEALLALVARVIAESPACET